MRFGGLFDLEVDGEVLGTVEIGEEAAQVLGQYRHLLLLSLQGDDGPPAAALQEEHALADGAFGADGETIEVSEVEGRAHDTASSVSDAVALTHRT